MYNLVYRCEWRLILLMYTVDVSWSLCMIHVIYFQRRTGSSEWTLDSSNSKKKRSIVSVTRTLTNNQLYKPIQDSSLILKEQQRKRSLDLDVELNMTPPLEKQFKRPPPGKNRRKPSKGHLVKRSVQIETPPTIVPPLDLPQEEDSPLPSAPPGMPGPACE